MTRHQPLAIPKLPGPVHGRWRVPGSKSITNRAYVLAALSERTDLVNALESDDTGHMRACLEQFGLSTVTLAAGALGEPQVRVLGGRKRLRTPSRALFVGNSGTTVRFLAAFAALVPGSVTFVGDAAMAKRPIADLVDALRQLGITVDCPSGCPPLTIHGGAITGTRVTMPGERSSQYFTALLLSAGMFDGDLDIDISGELVSRPYIDMTIRMVEQFGGRIDATPDGFTVHGRRAYGLRPAAGAAVGAYAIEPDASSASYPFALAAASGSTIEVPGLAPDGLQGDYAFVEVLRSMGAVVTSRDWRAGASTTVSGPARLRGIDVDMHHISDTVMTLAAIAPLCDGPTTIRNIGNIRIKETDRLAATVNELRRLGQEVVHGQDWLTINPRPLLPATIECYHDHRMAMSFAILGAVAGGVTVQDPACTAKTYPGFWDDLGSFYPPASRPW
jgi:3-phosphoshikimate 1-carboxyvinyltransferase